MNHSMILNTEKPQIKKMIKTTWKYIATGLLFCWLFLIAYGILRTGIDKLVERRHKAKEKIMSDMISTDEGRKKLAENLMRRRSE